MNLSESENRIRNDNPKFTGMNANLPSASPAIPEASSVLEWSVHPSSRHPVKTALTVMIVAMIAGALFQATDTLLYSLIAVIIFLVTLSPFFLRTEYRMDLHGVTMRRPGTIRHLRWEKILCVTTRASTVYLSPHASTSIRSRGAILLMCPENCDVVLDFIRRTVRNDDSQA